MEELDGRQLRFEKCVRYFLLDPNLDQAFISDTSDVCGQRFILLNADIGKKGLVSVRGLDPGIDMSNSDHSIPTWKVVVKEIHTPAMEKTHRVVYGRPFVANGCQISLRVCKLIEKLILRTEQPEQADLVDDVQFIVATELCKLGLCPWTAQQLCAALVEVSERPALLVGLKLWETG
ncbi:unnamed protein product [Fusarium graminearum]|nr:unnamed protein product [Fusarium graminearum]CAG1960940.1 unnamed protein product [Fusarium graminearum]